MWLKKGEPSFANNNITVFKVMNSNTRSILKKHEIYKTYQYIKKEKIERSIFMISNPWITGPISNVKLIKKIQKLTKCELVLHNSPKAWLTRYPSENKSFIKNTLRKIKTHFISSHAKYFFKTLSKAGVSIFTLSRGNQQELKKYYNVESKIRYNTYLFKEYELSSKKNIVTFIGRLSFEKNVSLLLHSWAKANTHDWTLRIIGYGSNKSILESFCRQKKLENVFFTGQVVHNQIMDYLKESKIFCLTSFNEGFPTVIVEAMNTGNAYYYYKF